MLKGMQAAAAAAASVGRLKEIETYGEYGGVDSCLDPQGVASAAQQAFFAHPLESQTPSRRCDGAGPVADVMSLLIMVRGDVPRDLQMGTRGRKQQYTGARRDVNRDAGERCSTLGAENWTTRHVQESDEHFRIGEVEFC